LDLDWLVEADGEENMTEKRLKKMKKTVSRNRQETDRKKKTSSGELVACMR
jgi:hypothetical protein